MYFLREMIDKKEIAEISWVPTHVQIADSLTKKGILSFKILVFISDWLVVCFVSTFLGLVNAKSSHFDKSFKQFSLV